MGGADLDRTWRLRGYTIERLLGAGSSGDVWRAHVSGTREPVALKRIRVTGVEQLHHAQREAALLTALDHPHLVRLHAFVSSDAAAVLVLDLADGGSLAELLTARGRLTPGEVITAIAPVAAALAYLHGEGVVHGDISAANILFTPEGVSLLADVGVARLLGADDDVCCTPAYVDPAVASGGVPGPSSDVFALAAVALHALTGEPAWPDGTVTQALARAASVDTGAGGDPAGFGERMTHAGVSPAMARVVGRALAMDPHRRGTAADLALDLRHSGEPVAVELSAGRRGPDAAPPPGPRHAARVGAPPPVATDGGRPGFERPAVLAGGAAPPTRRVGPRPRPVVPRARSRAARFAGRRVVVALCAVLAVAVLAAGGTVWAATRGGAPGRRASPPRPVVSSSSSSSSSSPPKRTPRSSPKRTREPAPRRTPRPTASTPPSSQLPASDDEAVAVLNALDALRADAFRRRDVTLLAQVYVPGPLRSADAATVRRVVPPGCGLLGARTRYTDVRSRSSGPRVVVLATASLPASRLVCQATVRGTARELGPTRLRIELTRTAAGIRIAAQRIV